MRPPPPRLSPAVPSGLDADTGEFPVVRAEMRTALKLNEMKTVIAIVVASLGVILGAWRVVISEAKAQTDAGMAPVVARVVVLEQQQQQVRADVHEVQVDIRELYRVVQTGARSVRLETPAPSPAPKDGGQ